MFAVPARSALFDFVLEFSHSKNFKSGCCLGGFRLPIALRLQKYVLFYLYRMYVPVFLKYAQPILETKKSE